MRRLLSFLAMVFTILAIIFFSVPSIGNPNVGLEFKGGYEIVYNVAGEDGEELETLEKYLPEERRQCEYLWKPVYDEYRRIGYRLDKEEQMKLF